MYRLLPPFWAPWDPSSGWTLNGRKRARHGHQSQDHGCEGWTLRHLFHLIRGGFGSGLRSQQPLAFFLKKCNFIQETQKEKSQGDDCPQKWLWGLLWEGDVLERKHLKFLLCIFCADQSYFVPSALHSFFVWGCCWIRADRLPFYTDCLDQAGYWGHDAFWHSIE